MMKLVKTKEPKRAIALRYGVPGEVTTMEPDWYFFDARTNIYVEAIGSGRKRIPSNKYGYVAVE